MAKEQGWWTLKTTVELTSNDREYIAELIGQGYTAGKIFKDEDELSYVWAKLDLLVALDEDVSAFDLFEIDQVNSCFSFRAAQEPCYCPGTDNKEDEYDLDSYEQAMDLVLKRTHEACDQLILAWDDLVIVKDVHIEVESDNIGSRVEGTVLVYLDENEFVSNPARAYAEFDQILQSLRRK
jgi:hypothetical protein